MASTFSGMGSISGRGEDDWPEQLHMGLHSPMGMHYCSGRNCYQDTPFLFSEPLGMGNFRVFNHDAAGPSGVQACEGQQQQHVGNQNPATFSPWMGGGPSMFTHQQFVRDSLVCEDGVVAMITWKSTECNEVSIAGSWDDWAARIPLQKTSKDFSATKLFPPGVYLFRFIVDGHGKCSMDFPIEYDDNGNAYNVLSLKDYVRNLSTESQSEPPSPPSSYDNPTMEKLDFNGLPPEVPPQLPPTLVDELPSSSVGICQYAESWKYEPGLQPLMLNHVYIDSSSGGYPVGLRSTERMRSQYMTTVTYKALAS